MHIKQEHIGIIPIFNTCFHLKENSDRKAKIWQEKFQGKFVLHLWLWVFRNYPSPTSLAQMQPCQGRVHILHPVVGRHDQEACQKQVHILNLPMCRLLMVHRSPWTHTSDIAGVHLRRETGWDGLKNGVYDFVRLLAAEILPPLAFISPMPPQTLPTPAAIF